MWQVLLGQLTLVVVAVLPKGMIVLLLVELVVLAL
jgi:hypothetical protein